jgi:hypothetical protein
MPGELLVCRCAEQYGSDPTIAEARDPSPNDELRQSVRCCLQDRTDDHDDRAVEDGAFPPEYVSKPYRGDGADEASEGIRADFLVVS